MTKRNAELERKALSLMLQNEEKQLKNALHGGANNDDSSDGSHGVESSDEDEAMKMAKRMSMQNANTVGGGADDEF